MSEVRVQRSSALLNRVAWCVSAMLVFSVVSSWAQSPPTLPPGYAESTEFRARLDVAVANSTLEPWQRDFMHGLVGTGASPGAADAAPNPIGAADENGEWEQAPPPTERHLHTAIYDPVRDRMVVYGGYDDFAYRHDVWALNLAGAPAWTELSPTGTPPSARADHTAIYDPVRERMIVFGGSDDSLHNDVWALSLSDTPAWSELSPTGIPPSARSGHTAIYDPVRDRMIVFGGNDQPWPPRNDVWALSLSGTPSWSELSPEGVPPTPRYAHTAIYDPLRDRMVVCGGYDGSFPNDVWALSLADTPAWTALAPQLSYGILSDHSAIYDPVRDRMVVFHGGDPYDVWALSFSGTPAWSPLTYLTPPRDTHTAIYDPVRDRMIVFGGYDFSKYRNDVWALSFSDTPGWSEIAYTLRPSKRYTHSAIYDWRHDRMIVFGGWDGSFRNDVWEFSLADTPAWRELNPIGPLPPARSGHTAIYDPVRDRMIVYGGYNSGSDVWALSLSGTPAWSMLSPTGAVPAPQIFHTAIYDPLRDRMVVFGNGIWALYLSGTPSWSELIPVGTGPPGGTAIYDPVRDRMVVWGYHAWALSLAGTPAWSELNPAGAVPAGRSGCTAIYDTLRDRMVVFGGSGQPRLNDAWALSLAGTPEWSELSPTGSLPIGRQAHTAIYDPRRDRMVVFGGNGPGLRNDVCLLNWGNPPVGVQQTAPTDLRFGSVFPNPTRDGTSIQLDLPVEMSVRVTVYDVAGRLVQRIADRRMPAGSHTVSWAMGRGGDRPLPPGIYFCRVRLGNREFTRRVVVVR